MVKCRVQKRLKAGCLFWRPLLCCFGGSLSLTEIGYWGEMFGPPYSLSPCQQSTNRQDVESFGSRSTPFEQDSLFANQLYI